MNQSYITRLHEVTGLGRPLDLRMKSNRIAVAGAASAGGLSVLLSWLDNGQLSLMSAASVAAGVFLAWALVREIDPDNEPSAYLAMLVSAFVGLIAPPAALVVAVLLLAVRVLSGTVGTQLRTTDLLVLTAGAAYAGTQPVAWPIVGLTAYSVIRSGHRHAKAFATAMPAIAFLVALLTVSELTPGIPGFGTWVLLVALGLSGWRRIRVVKVTSSADSGTRIDAVGVRIARLATLTAIAAGTVMAPDTALSSLGPAIAAFGAMVVWPRRNPAPEQTRDEPLAILEPPPPVAIAR